MIEISRKETIRTLGLYQPYASLMGHGKIETRWIASNRKAPFPKGLYLIYSTKKAYKEHEFKYISGEFYRDAKKALTDDKTVNLLGHALFIGRLTSTEKAFPLLMPQSFVGLQRIEDQLNVDDDANELKIDEHTLWFLHFQEVKAIEPFSFKGKQGVGILSDEDRAKIKFVA